MFLILLFTTKKMFHKCATDLSSGSCHVLIMNLLIASLIVIYCHIFIRMLLIVLFQKKLIKAFSWKIFKLYLFHHLLVHNTMLSDNDTILLRNFKWIKVCYFWLEMCLYLCYFKTVWTTRDQPWRYGTDQQICYPSLRPIQSNDLHQWMSQSAIHSEETFDRRNTTNTRKHGTAYEASYVGEPVICVHKVYNT